MQRPSFLDQEPPPGYVPGVGRGATGFSTRGDQARKTKTPNRLQQRENVPKVSQYVDQDLDEASVREDEEAGRVFAAIESKLSTRKKTSQSANGNSDNHIPKQFADLKRSLATVSEDEWLSLPDAGDLTRKNKRERLQDQLSRKEYAAPDALINRGVNLTKLTEERERLLGRQLDNSLLEGSKSDALLADDLAANYLEELESSRANNLVNEDEVEETKRMRMVLLSYRKADPMRAEGWIASARLEEKACKFQRAKSIMEEACATCPKNDAVWLERIRMNASDATLCRALVAEGIRFNPKSLSLWMKATELETTSFNKRRVVMKALHELPKNEELWKQIIMLESDKPERLRILRRAVELVPTSVDLWRELVELQAYSDAKKSVNTARKHIPMDYRLWILAAQVEERAGEYVTEERLQKILVKGMNQLQANHSNPGLSEWLNHALSLDAAGVSPKVSIAIVHAAMSMEDLNTPSIVDTINGLNDSSTKITAFAALLKGDPSNHAIWKALRTTCQKIARQELLYEVYEDILFSQKNDHIVLIQNPVLPLIYAKEVWKYGRDVSKALDILNRSLELNPNYLDFWLAKLKVLCFSSQFEDSEETFRCAFKQLSRSEVPHLERLYLKYVSFLRFQNRNREAIDFLEQECLAKFPQCYKFHIQKGQIHHDLGHLEQMRETYYLATKTLPQRPIPWILLAKADEIDFKNPTKARSQLDIALLKNPQEEILHLAKIEMECREGFEDQARLLVLQALQRFPKSPEIWAANVKLIPSKKASTKKTIFQDALRSTHNSCQVLIEIGLSFFRDAQYSTALKWFERATKSNPKFGDAWVWLARCSKKLNKDISSIHDQVEEHEPVHGPLWISMSKNMRYQYNNPSKLLDLLLEEEKQGK